MDSIFVDVPVHLIQQVRLVHALAEGPVHLVLPRAEFEKLEAVDRRFHPRFREGETGDIALSRVARWDHRMPRTAIGSLERPLIFPHTVADALGADWPAERDEGVGFTGLITAPRQAFLEQWLARQVGTREAGEWRKRSRSVLFRMVRRVRGIGENWQVKLGPATIRSSTRGRSFPTKGWDEEYYASLRRTAFALCPAGDWDWTYRFFEAALCGAIPAVERAAPAYTGFRYVDAASPRSEWRWSREDAEWNRALAVERLTVGADELERELQRLLRA